MDTKVDRPADTVVIAATKVNPAPADRPWFKLSPINARRLRAFKANKRGYYSFVLFVALFLHHALRRVHRERQAVPREV